MDPTTRRVLLSSSKKGDPVYVDDVFSTHLYAGSAVAQTITNGIDLSTEGGLVWMKSRTSTYPHILSDSERSWLGWLETNSTDPWQGTTSQYILPNTDGFTFSQGGLLMNGATHDYTSWTFRKAPGFFDVVTWNGDGADGRQIAHTLGSAPGMVIIKCTSDAENWYVYHRSSSTTYGSLNFSAAFSATGTGMGGYNMQEIFGNSTTVTVPDANNITVARFGGSNSLGRTYVAYLFAHDDQSFGTGGNESIIKCGTYAGNGSTTAGPEIDLGFEPQWLMVKRTDSNDSGNSAFHSWIIQDNMRGLNAPPHTSASGYNNLLFANLTAAEGKRGNGASTAVGQAQFLITPTGFTVQSAGTEFNDNGGTYIYMAIRRPHKPPEAATDVFNISSLTNSNDVHSVGFPTDMFITDRPEIAGSTYLVTRSTNDAFLETPNNNAEATGYKTFWDFDRGNNFKLNGFWSGAPAILYQFKRAPGFFDVVAYSGTGADQVVNHGLGVIPELMIAKARSTSTAWRVFYKDSGTEKFLQLSEVNAASNIPASHSWSPTATTFRADQYFHLSASSQTFVAYLFATLPGISKVGSYTGNSGYQEIDCGFTNGARFVLIKRTDNTGDWYVWDTMRGIISGNDPYSLLNSSASQVTNTDYIAPLTSGFTVTSSAPAALNATGGSYIFLAIA